jgi:hypothetical protein
MATKHLYVLEDVAAQLLYSLQTNELANARQAANELRVSQEDEFLWSLLTFAWLLQDPSHTMESERYRAFLQNDPVSFLHSLRGGSPLPSLSLFPNEAPAKPPKHGETPTEPIPWQKLPTGWSTSQAYTLWRTNKQAVDKGYWEKAYRLTSPLLGSDCEAVVSLLHGLQHTKMANLLETTVFLPLSHRVLAHAFACANIPNTSSTHKIQDPKDEGRIVSIDPKALQLWHIQSKPTTDLMGFPTLVAKPDASRYWKAITTLYDVTETLQFKRDEDVETFYTDYFPNDIPDEWSNEERQRSHGIVVPEFLKNPWTPVLHLL